YQEHWGLSRAPFQTVPDPDFFYPFPAYQEILDKLLYVIKYGKGVAVVTGEIGSGKSTLSRVVIVRLDEEKYDVGLVIDPSVSPEELLNEVALQLGISPPNGQRPALIRAINEHLLMNAQKGRMTVLIIDEAHTITQNAAFEELRMLLNFQFSDRHLLALILLGQPELKDVIAQQQPLDQRVAIRLNLGALSEKETASYIDFRLKRAEAKGRIFTADAIKMIHRVAGGIPRNINNLCDLCLFEGMRKNMKKIGAPLVKVVRAFT
ncbi:MAG: AAA family ATPase, partial [candidate division NC10 bacterium]|nr:AAA family ATPase [candidate division NC10 bacterium]